MEKVTSGGALTASGSAVITVKNCGSRSLWTVAYWAASNGGYDSETVQDVMLGAVERRFGNSLPTSPVEWLTDNGSAYRSYQTRQFARMVGLEPKHTAVRSPESNGMAESFVKTMKRDYISIMPKPDGLTAVKNLAEAFEHYNEWHPHSALGYRSPREYLRRRTSNGLSGLC
ncbi:integrase core domain-containing protein [Klebsiella quasipneumoniae]